MVSASLAVSLRAGQDSMETLLGGETLRTVYVYVYIYVHGHRAHIFLGKEILKNTKPCDSSKINCCQEASSDGVLTKMSPLLGAHMFIWNGHLLVRFLQPISPPDLSLHPSFGSSGLMTFDARRLGNGRMRPSVKKIH